MKRLLLAGTVLAGSALAISPAGALVVTESNGLPALVNGSSATRDVTVAAGDLAGSTGIVAGVTIEIDFSKCSATGGGGDTGGCFDSSIGITRDNQIVFSLTAPSGTEVSLVAEDTFGFCCSDLTRHIITFDDAGLPLPAGPEDGTFAPVGSLADFNGEGALGDWSLFIEDTEAFSNNNGTDPLVLHEYTLRIAVAEVPEPAAGAALLVGLTGLWLGRRPRNRPIARNRREGRQP